MNSWFKVANMKTAALIQSCNEHNSGFGGLFQILSKFSSLAQRRLRRFPSPSMLNSIICFYAQWRKHFIVVDVPCSIFWDRLMFSDGCWWRRRFRLFLVIILLLPIDALSSEQRTSFRLKCHCHRTCSIPIHICQSRKCIQIEPKNIWTKIK